MEFRGKMPKWGWLSGLFTWRKSANARGASRVAAAAETPSETAYNNTLQQKKKKPIISVEQEGNARVLKVVAICGSLRKASCNSGLIRAAIEIAKESIPDMEIELVDISNLPFLNTDLEVDGRFPDAVESFRKRFLDADCVLFSTPEYNYSVTAPVKNAIDWASRSPNVMAGKPAAIMSVAGSLGGARAQYHLRQIGVYLDLHFINKPELFVNGYQSPQKFDEDGNLIDKAIRERVKKLLLALQEFSIELLN
jgi:NAD(P)H-dependent FMN reductase